MREYHTVDVYRILRQNGLAGATFDFDHGTKWVLPTMKDIADLSTGVAHEHWVFRQGDKERGMPSMIYDQQECNCHDFTQTFLHLARMRHIRSMNGPKTGRLACGGVIYTPEYSFDFGRFNGRVKEGAKLANSGRHEIVWFLTDDDEPGAEKVWYLEPQTDELWPLQAGEVQTVERIYAL